MKEPLPQLNSVVHQRVRLAVLSALVGSGPHSFVELREVTGATDGNLSIHLTTLEESGYVTIEKSFERKRPKTTVDVTKKGKRALAEYLTALEQILKLKES